MSKLKNIDPFPPTSPKNPSFSIASYCILGGPFRCPQGKAMLLEATPLTLGVPVPWRGEMGNNHVFQWDLKGSESSK